MHICRIQRELYCTYYIMCWIYTCTVFLVSLEFISTGTHADKCTRGIITGVSTTQTSRCTGVRHWKKTILASWILNSKASWETAFRRRFIFKSLLSLALVSFSVCVLFLSFLWLLRIKEVCDFLVPALIVQHPLT